MQGSVALAPLGQYPPPSHSRQTVALEDGWCVPPAHGIQETAPVLFETLPGAQGAGSVEPVLHELPRGHGLHSPASVRPLV